MMPPHFLQNVTDDPLLPSLKAMAKNAVDGLSITDLPQSSQSLSQQQQQLQQTTAQQPPTGPVGSSNISQTGSLYCGLHVN